ncbi:MAG: hypothetical protein CM15mP120_15390 [Pseudomonadota bacterium]|nr:MAG: hypothetical protein CM15mP120_15390 [Pseudomonadota bacterium]
MNKFHSANVQKAGFTALKLPREHLFRRGLSRWGLGYNLTFFGVSDVRSYRWGQKPRRRGSTRPPLGFSKAKTAAAIKKRPFRARTVVWFRTCLLAAKSICSPLSRQTRGIVFSSGKKPISPR